MILIASTWTEKEVNNHAQAMHITSPVDFDLIKALLLDAPPSDPNSNSSNPFSDGHVGLLVRKSTHMEYVKDCLPASRRATCIFRVVPDVQDLAALRDAMIDADVVVYSNPTPVLRAEATGSQLAIIDAAAAAGISHFLFNLWLRPPCCQCNPKLNALGTIVEEHLKASGLNYTILKLARPFNLELRLFLGTHYIGSKYRPDERVSYLDQHDAIAAITAVIRQPTQHQNTCYTLVSCVCTRDDMIEGFYARTGVRLIGLGITFDDQIRRIREIDADLGTWLAGIGNEYPTLRTPCCSKVPDTYGDPQALRSLTLREPRSAVDNMVEAHEKGYSRSAIRLSIIIRHYFQSKLRSPEKQGPCESEPRPLKRDGVDTDEKSVVSR